MVKVRFPLGAARPVPCAKGGAVCWHNVIHWGGACGKGETVPRIALAATFKRRDAKPTVSTFLRGPCLTFMMLGVQPHESQKKISGVY